MLKALAQKFIPIGPMAFLALNLRGLHIAARLRGLRVRVGRDAIDVMNGDRTIRLQRAHWFYVFDVMDSFDYYFSAVAAFVRSRTSIVDYSIPRFHEVVGYGKHPVYFPSLAEPIVTTTQYSDFAALKPGMTVIDLGAYSGLTSMMFQDAVGPEGTVVAVEADENNVIAIRKNFELYRSLTGVAISLLEGAAWKDDSGLEFSSEGNMGSSAAAIVGADRGPVRTVPSFTLSSIAERTGLDRVDFIKCDIEGAEQVVFQDAAFFRKHTPRIIVEMHVIRGCETTDTCLRDLESHGYSCRRIVQQGVILPLLECSPPQRESRPAGEPAERGRPGL